MMESEVVDEHSPIEFAKVLTLAAVENGIKVTYFNGEQQTVFLSNEKRNKLFDLWLGL